jgi:hypothetical protein
MRKANGFVGILVLALILIPALAQAIPTVSLDLLNPTINVGESFSVNVVAHGVTDIDPVWGLDELLSFGFDVVTPSGLAYNGATVAGTFEDDSALFPDVAGHVFPGISGDSIFLGSLDFTALTGGDFSLGIFSDTSAGQGLFTLVYGPLDISTSTSVTVHSVPEPHILLLMSSAVGSLVLVRRRRRNA